MDAILTLNAVAHREQRLLEQMEECLKSSAMKDLHELLDEWEKTSQVIHLPRIMAMQICAKTTPRSPQALLGLFDRLLSLGVSVDMRMAQESLLHHAASHGNDLLVMHLLSHGAIPAALGRSGGTPLHEAVKAGSTSCVELLMDAASVLASNTARQTPLLMACKEPDRLPIIKALLRAGSNVDARDSSGKTPLLCLVSRPNRWKDLREMEEAFLLLVDHGADLEACDANGNNVREIYRANAYQKERDAIDGWLDRAHAHQSAKRIEDATVAPSPARSSKRL